MKSSQLRRIARVYLMSISFWFGISLLMGWQYRSLWSSYFDLLVMAGARAFSFALWTPPIFYLAGKYLNHSRNRIRYALLWSLGAPVFVGLYTGTLSVLAPPYDDVNHRFVSRSFHSWLEMIGTGFADVIFIYIAIVVAAHAYEYFQRARNQELEASEFHRALAVSELHALKMQLHPHFLFNTLHGISTLIDSDPTRAREMIVKLSSLLRTALQQTDSDLIPLREELKFVEEYLDLEKMRLGARLTVNLYVEPGTLSLLVPHLVLQPLIENAVRHGIGSSREQGWIEISSNRKKDSLELVLRNSVGANRPQGMGVGLRNTASRLQHLYSGEALFSFEFVNESTAVATLVLPALGGRPQVEVGAFRDAFEVKVQRHASADR
jgi:two-component system, LytTR family, sensor kinase